MTSLVSHSPQHLDPLQQDFEGDHYFPEHSLGHQFEEVTTAVQISSPSQSGKNPQEPYEEYESEDDEEDLWSSDEESQGEDSTEVLKLDKTSENPQFHSTGHKTVSFKTITAQDFYFDEKQLELDSQSNILAITPLENGENNVNHRDENLFFSEHDPSNSVNETFFVPRGAFFII
jgi:hypothetical protein